MSTLRVLSIEDHRNRRDRRLNQTLALLAPDPCRARLGAHLSRLLARVGGDRAALVWLDEYEPTIAHPHVVVDLLRDRPRRDFELLPLLEAWDRGIPGLVDLPDLRSGNGAGPASLVAVALGSDGRRAWFVVVDGAAFRTSCSPSVVDEIMFRAGELSGLVLHPEQGPPHFAGWRSLSDARETADELDAERVEARFMVLRFLLSLVSDDFSSDPELLAEHAMLLEDELPGWEDEPEAEVWKRVFEAGLGGDLEALLQAAIDLAAQAARHGEVAGAAEALGAAYALAEALRDVPAGATIARELGRAHRNAGEWGESESWYECAVSLAQVLDDPAREALALDGWANTLRVKGNLPRSLQYLLRALDLAKGAADRQAIGSVQQALMTLHTLMGRLDEALHHGWCAVDAFETRRDQVRALVAVAGVLLDHGEPEFAEQAYAVALAHVDEPYFRLFALDGHAHAAALRGSRAEYLKRVAIVDAADWRPGGPDFEGQVCLYRGRAWEGLGDPGRARSWYQRALKVAEAHRLAQTSFAAQDGLDRLDRMEVDETRQPSGPHVGHDVTRAVSWHLEAVDRRLAQLSS